MSNLQLTDQTYVANTYARFPVEIVSGKHRFLQFIGGRRI